MRLTEMNKVLFGLSFCAGFVKSSESQNDYKVEDLPGLSEISESLRPIMHAGQLEIDSNTDKNLFFWRFARQSTNTTLSQKRDNRLVIWLNGGPGCSSMDGALMEVGPLRIQDDGKVKFNEGTWMESADMLFVDQPGGTGFSYTNTYDKELTEASSDFVAFIKKYLELFPEDSKRQIWLSGESYAGQYIPYFADYILEENSNKDSDFNIDLKGLLIGNGWIEPDIQSLSYVPFAMENGILEKTNPQFTRALEQHEKCQNSINDKDDDSFEKVQCNKVLDVLLRASLQRHGSERTCMNMYDYRKIDTYPSCGANWPEDLVNVTPFLNNPEVQKYLNLKNPKKWSECDSRVSSHFSPKTSKKSFELFPSLLKQLPIMLFSGDKDIICNYKGTEMLIEKMDINNGQKGFSNESHVIDWYYDDKQVGEIRGEYNLTYVKIFNSSHMVPFDLPEISRGLLDIMLPDSKTIDSKLMTPVYDLTSDNFYYSKTYSDAVDQETDTSSEEGEDKQQETSEEPSSDVDDDDDDSTTTTTTSKRGSLFYLFEFSILVSVIIIFYYCYKSYTGGSTKSSFLSNASSKKKKRVHWFDDSDEADEGPDVISGGSVKSHSMLGSVLSKLGYGGGSGGDSNYSRVDGDDRDIELGEVEDQFIVQSDDEDYTGGSRSSTTPPQQQKQKPKKQQQKNVDLEDQDVIFER